MSGFYRMPKIDLAKLQHLTPDQLEIVKGIINSKTGELRASKPKVQYETLRGRHIPEKVSGSTAYVWRMVAFMVSPMPAHQCMPVMAFCDLPYDVDSLNRDRRDLEKELDKIADAVVDTIKASEWHGIKRWGYALGYLSRPEGEL